MSQSTRPVPVRAPTRMLGIACLAGMATLLLLALVLTPPDQRVDEATNTVVGQFDAVRLLYVHFPTILVAYLGFVITALGSAMFLWKKSIWWDTVAHAAAEVGALFLALTLVTGIIWGRPIWNTWWEWGDVRVMTTLMLFLMFLGYLALRRVPGDPTVRARRSAIVALISVLNIPIVNRSVEWWETRTLHQKSTATAIKWENLTFFTVFFGMVVFTAIFAWLLIHRFRLGWLERQVEGFDLDQAILDRRAVVNRVRSSTRIGTYIGTAGVGMTHIGYIVAGWGISLAAIAFYAWSIIRRGRTLSRQVPADKRRWISSDV